MAFRKQYGGGGGGGGPRYGNNRYGRGRSSYRPSGNRPRQAQRRYDANDPFVGTGMFPTQKSGLFRGTLNGEWFDRLVEVVEQAKEVGSVAVFLKKNIEGGSERPWFVWLKPNDPNYKPTNQKRNDGDGAPEGTGDADEAEDWNDDNETSAE